MENILIRLNSWKCDLFRWLFKTKADNFLYHFLLMMKYFQGFFMQKMCYVRSSEHENHA
jgi:hypothetical protein